MEREHAGRVLTRKMKVTLTALSLPVVLLLFGGLGLMAWGAATAFPDKSDANQEVPGRRKAVGVGLMVGGGVLLVGALALVTLDPSWLSNRYLKKRLMNEIGSRASRLVNPEAPDALFVEVVPKTNWGKLQLESAADVGLLRIDLQTREILFEGDRERYRIPAAALISCNLEFFVEGQGTHGATKLFYVVLRAHHTSAFWEAPIRERGEMGLFKAGKRKRKAAALQTAIEALCDIKGAN